VIATDHDKTPMKRSDETADPTEALALAEEAEAEAAAAEAAAEAARAKAKAMRLRREAAAVGSTNGAADTKTDDVDPTNGDAPQAVESDADSLEAADVLTPSVDTAATADESEDLDAAVDDDADRPAPKTKRRRIGLIVGVIAATLAVLCSAGLITLSVLMVKHHQKVEAEQQLRAEYNAAGRQSVVTLMSLDFNNAQANVQRIIDNSTGQFKTDFQSQAADFVKVAQDSKVVTDVNVTATAVDQMSPESALVMVAATSRVTNAAGAKQEPRAWRLAVTLERDGGQIKMSKVEFVP
jgi:Mce-associated membrane protein